MAFFSYCLSKVGTRCISRPPDFRTKLGGGGKFSAYTPGFMVTVNSVYSMITYSTVIVNSCLCFQKLFLLELKYGIR